MISCAKDKDLNKFLSIEIPAGFPQPVYQFTNNQPTQKGFDLGRMLFYDQGLSKDGTVSCGDCHQQFAGFGNLDHATSHGVDNCFGKRNAPVLFNLTFKDNFFLDGGVTNLELAPLNAMTDPCEMANDLNKILVYLKSKPEYQQAFQKAFDSDEITSQKMFRALAQFQGMMISADSKYDQVKAKTAQFTDQELRGYQLFSAKCASCHKEPLFSDNSFRNNGLDITSLDLGRSTITSLASDDGKFKVPTLRNVEVSRPYMHDGRFKTLEQVLDHYQNNIKPNKNLDPLLKQDLALTDTYKADIIAFLKTLTDLTFLKNPKYSEE
ncbi:cytochrome-c peroxidase [Pedobacter psychrophilus]|uniref:Cytochrome-c peroxidase n=1 Tax=Pedobacter psychrophilus TaxID=1826909 RepID=A0A179DG54_9SPHI|nr:cytochrome-c peroxidase [Pedobacter psychrophilus]